MRSKPAFAAPLLMLAAIVLGGVVVVLSVLSYNRFVRQRNLMRDSWANIDTELRRLAVTAFEAVAGVGLARIDFFYVDDKAGPKLWLNEINTLPGFTAISMYPKLWQIDGLSLPDLVDRLVQIALQRHADRQTLDREIKSWIASLS